MKNKILLVVCIIFGLLFLNSGLNKIFQYMPMPDDMPEDAMKFFAAAMQIGWLLPLVAVAEIVGGVLIIIPKTRALGAIIIFPITVGIVLTHLINVPENLFIAVIVFAINVWVIVENWHRYTPMVK